MTFISASYTNHFRVRKFYRVLQNKHIRRVRRKKYLTFIVVLIKTKSVSKLLILPAWRLKCSSKKYVFRINEPNNMNKTRRRYVVKHNLITEVYLMNVMENNYMFRPVLAIIRLSMELKG